MPPDLTAIRTDYARAGLDLPDLDPSPTKQIERWLGDAIAAGHPDPTAMTLGTATAEGEPSSRVVLLKGVDERGLVFFTNYESAKGRELAENPRACCNLFWVLLERQLRVTGVATKTSREESEAYFRSRPRESQIGAWASEQSAVLRDRAELEERVAILRARFAEGEIPCPPHWGGFRVAPERVELWQGRPNRLHDRLRYTRSENGTWRIDRLSP